MYLFCLNNTFFIDQALKFKHQLGHLRLRNRDKEIKPKKQKIAWCKTIKFHLHGMMEAIRCVTLNPCHMFDEKTAGYSHKNMHSSRTVASKYNLSRWVKQTY